MKFQVHNFNGILDDVIPKLDIASNVFSADRYIGWQDIDEYFINVYKQYKAFSKKSFLMSHCFGSCNHYTDANKYTALADRYLVWGKFDYELAEKAHISRRTIITGSPIFGHVKEKQKHEGVNIVFCPYHNSMVNEEMDESILISNKLSEYNATVYTKVLTGCDALYPNMVVSNRNEEGHIDITFDLLSKADVVVVNDPITTFALFAFAAGVPVISVVEEKRLSNPVGQNLKYVKHALQTGMTETTMQNLHNTLDEVLSNDTKKEQRAYWCEYMGVNIKNPIDNILNAINS